MAAVQFFGAPAVVKAYESYGADCWGIVDGKELAFAGDSVDTLRDTLDMLGPGGSGAPEILRAYKSCESADEIDRNTEYDRSFKFKLTESSAVRGMGGLGMGGPMGDPIMGAVYKKFADKVAGAVERTLDGDDEEPETFMEKVQTL